MDSIFNEFKMSAMLLWSHLVILTVCLMYFISTAYICDESDVLFVHALADTFYESKKQQKNRLNTQEARTENKKYMSLTYNKSTQ